MVHLIVLQIPSYMRMVDFKGEDTKKVLELYIDGISP